MADVDLVVVETFDSRPEADLVRGLLEAAGIETIIQADTAGGMRPHLAMVGSDSDYLSAPKMRHQPGACSMPV